VAVKFNIKKAFVEQSYLLSTLRTFGFGDVFSNWRGERQADS